MAHFTLAPSAPWTSNDGERQKRPEWHRIVVWGKLAEFCGQYVSKGRQVYIEGRLQTREWEDREGNKRKTTEINANIIQLLGPRPSGGDAGGTARFPVVCT